MRFNKPVVNHLRLDYAAPGATCCWLLPFTTFFFYFPAHTTWLSRSRAMNLVGIAVLTEPDASRAPRIIGYIRCTGGRGGAARRHASAGSYRNLSPARRLANPSQREESLGFSARSDIPRGRIARTVNRDTFLLLVPLD